MAIAQIGVFPGSFFEEILNSHMKIRDLGCINHSKTGRSCDLMVDLMENLKVDLMGNLTVDFTENLTVDLAENFTVDLTGNIMGNIMGNITGNIMGNITRNITGNLMGNITGSANFKFPFLELESLQKMGPGASRKDPI